MSSHCGAENGAICPKYDSPVSALLLPHAGGTTQRSEGRLELYNPPQRGMASEWGEGKVRGRQSRKEVVDL